MKTLGKYEVLEELGAGAMGKVFHGRDRVLQREVAIKIISTEDADVELKQRFYREARSCGRLSHPNIVTVFDLGEQQGTSYIAMEYLDGEDLRKFIDRKSFMPLEGKLQLMGEVADGLGHAHDNRIVHRDIKPSNIFLLKSGRPKILDFGIARVFASNLTRVGNALGTPQYMAPEQIRGKETDARSDIFSAGVVFFELLTHEHPFGTTDVPRKIIQEPPKSLRALVPLMPEKLDQILNRAMAKDPDERYQTASEFAKAFRKLSFEVLGQCSRLVDEALANRQRILESVDVISKAGLPWIQKKLHHDRIDVGITAKITPESAQTTNASLHYFSLSILAADLARTAEALAEILRAHERVLRDLEQARKFLAEGKTTEAVRLLDVHEERRSDYPEIAILRANIERGNATKAESPRLETQKRAVEKPGAHGIEKALTGDLSTVFATSVKGKDDKGNPDLLAVRKRIASLLDEDIDKCLAEIEILPPALANDSVIDSYWVRALSIRSAEQAASAAAKVETPVASPGQRQSRPNNPGATPVQPALPRSLPARASEKRTLFATVGSKFDIRSRQGDAKWVGGIAAVAVLLIVVSLYSFTSGSDKPAGAAGSPAQTPNVRETAPAVSPAPLPPPEEKISAVVEPKTRPLPSPPSGRLEKASQQQPRPVVQADWSKELAAAKQAFADEKYDAAIALCGRILRAQPANKEALDLRRRALDSKALEAKLKGQ